MTVRSARTVVGCLLAGALVAIDLGPATPSRNAERIRSSAERPLPTLPQRSPAPGTGVWVPDQFVPYPGERTGVFVPGHWELPIGDGLVQVPPAAVNRPDSGGMVILPGGPRRLPEGVQGP